MRLLTACIAHRCTLPIVSCLLGSFTFGVVRVRASQGRRGRHTGSYVDRGERREVRAWAARNVKRSRRHDTSSAGPTSHSGEGGIRTHGTVSRSGAFKAPALVHYATSPGAVPHARDAASIQILADPPELRASEKRRRRQPSEHRSERSEQSNTARCASSSRP